MCRNRKYKRYSVLYQCRECRITPCVLLGVRWRAVTHTHLLPALHYVFKANELLENVTDAGGSTKLLKILQRGSLSMSWFDLVWPLRCLHDQVCLKHESQGTFGALISKLSIHLILNRQCLFCSSQFFQGFKKRGQILRLTNCFLCDCVFALLMRIY